EAGRVLRVDRGHVSGASEDGAVLSVAPGWLGGLGQPEQEGIMSEAAKKVEHSSVPRLNDLRVLKMMRTIKDRNRARYALASVAMIRLHFGGGKHSELFAPIPSVKETKAIVAEAKAVAWQKALLDQLMDAELIEQLDGGCYSVPLDRKADIEEIAASPFSGDGLPLKQLLWPADYADDEPQPEPPELQPDASDAEQGVLQQLTEALAAMVDSMKATAENVASVNARMEEVERRIGAKVDEVKQSVADVRAVAASFNEASEKYDNLIRLLEDDDRRQLAVALTQIQEF